MQFGTSGLRGLVVDLEGHASALYATAFARHLMAQGLAKVGSHIYVGGDFRPSSPDIAATCIGALQRAGLVPIDCGALPTPALALYAMRRGAASLMVTGSHIPADRNGIKFYRPDGEIDKADEQAITQIAGEISDQIVDLTPGFAQSAKDEANAEFIARYQGLLGQGALSSLRIGVYQHSTVARDGLVSVLADHGAEVVPLGFSDTFIPVDTEAVSGDTIARLRDWALEHRLDAIVSADGDGDRPLVADETGQPLRGDLLGLMVAQFLKAGVVVTPVTSNSGIEASGDFKVLRTRVGSPFVIAGMKAALDEEKRRGITDSGVMGFEANGGVLTASDFTVGERSLSALPTRDSFLPILACLSLAVQAKKPLSAFATGFALPVAAADRLERFPSETSARLMAYLKASPDNLAGFLAPIGAVASVDETDGLRVTLSDGRILHLRPSGNAPEMRCYVEARTADAAEALLSQGLQLIRGFARQG
jgi:phosphomannomutase